MPERVIYEEIEFDERDFWCPWLTTKIPWKQISRLAYGFEVDQRALESWNFWGFQTNDPDFLLSVNIGSISTMRCDDEIRRRFGNPSIPPIKNWIENNEDSKTYVIYPEADIGKSLYQITQKHWYSLNAELYFAQK